MWSFGTSASHPPRFCRCLSTCLVVQLPTPPRHQTCSNFCLINCRVWAKAHAYQSAFQFPITNQAPDERESQRAWTHGDYAMARSSSARGGGDVELRVAASDYSWWLPISRKRRRRSHRSSAAWRHSVDAPIARRSSVQGWGDEATSSSVWWKLSRQRQRRFPRVSSRCGKWRQRW